MGGFFGDDAGGFFLSWNRWDAWRRGIFVWDVRKSIVEI